jgi:hypothetical protein
MNAIMACISVAALGIDVGWQPLPGGGVEYIIQIAPQAMEVLKAGDWIQSDVPAEVKHIRAYRIMVGTGKLPRELPAASGSDRPDPLLPPPRTPAIEPDLPRAPLLVPPQNTESTGPQPAPRALPPEPAGKPMAAEKAVFVEQAGAPQQAGPKPADSPPPPARPWTVLILVTLALCASLGGNVYLGWITWDVHRRYRALARQPGPPSAA